MEAGGSASHSFDCPPPFALAGGSGAAVASKMGRWIGLRRLLLSPVTTEARGCAGRLSGAFDT